MKRWIVKAGATGVDDMMMKEDPQPKPGPGEVRVKVHAVSLNYRDQIIIQGLYGQGAKADFIPISDGAGVIDALGDSVDGWSVGDKVTSIYFKGWSDGPPAGDLGFGLGADGDDGMLAEYVVLKADRVTPMPRTLSFEEAACLPCAALTAWTALNGDRPYKRMVAKGEKVLVTGTGGVALFALIFAHAAGAQGYATTSRDDKVDHLRALGASDVLNYRKHGDWGEQAFQQTGGFDHVVNAVGGSALDQCIAAVGAGGEIAFMGLFDLAETPTPFMYLMIKGAAIRGTAVGSSLAHKDMVEFVDVHAIKPPIAATFALADAKRAYAIAASGDVFGKVVIQLTS